ncbi:MAG: GNAT family N-acetyltransferase [Pseudomonadota bacterium]
MEDVRFRAYQETDRAVCMRILDANTPRFFATNEREQYLAFLDTESARYRVCVTADKVIGAFGLSRDGSGDAHLNWILIDPAAQGRGIGSKIMAKVISDARDLGARSMKIAASHKSCPFFERLGATVESTQEHGWGNGMHRVDMRLAL